MIQHVRLALPLLAVLSLGACAPGGMNPQTRSIVGGTAGGAALGGVVGSFSGNAGLGALLGAGAGAGAGYLYDQSQRNSYNPPPRGRGRW
ncbi:glycine zipper domain-containing protein [Teichococcus oryzae]|uniref:Glycine zipper domain-containing protein n=1 Tax=Teichococcus oryzae TaxID=1608942 RepID=A0A5B2TL38_9PROT|nr:glycine zipper domain-containing protein [Pseudoroseomonas oryzae]KAA2214873.1 hypothetical protein F0Q34_04115 [Pseudoroseomonas oryzae]